MVVLTRQFRLPARVEQQQRRAVAPVIRFAAQGLPLAVAAAQVEGDLAQRVPVVGKHIHRQQLDLIGAGRHRGGHGAAHRLVPSAGTAGVRWCSGRSWSIEVDMVLRHRDSCNIMHKHANSRNPGTVPFAHATFLPC
jgi:hypothetical protein